MLTDPQQLAIVAAGDFTALSTALNGFAPLGVLSIELTDTPSQGSVRSGTDGTDKVKIRIQHSQTNENAPLGTNRALIRLDRTRAHPELGTPIVSSAYLVVASPQGGVFTMAEVLKDVRSLLLYLLVGNADSGSISSANADLLARVLNGTF